MELNRLVELASEKRANGEQMEEVLRWLRDQGATIIDSVKIVRLIENVSLGKVKEIIDLSETWEDHLAESERIRDIAEQALLALELEEPTCQGSDDD